MGQRVGPATIELGRFPCSPKKEGPATSKIQWLEAANFELRVGRLGHLRVVLGTPSCEHTIVRKYGGFSTL